MSNDLQKTLAQEIKNLTRDIEAMEYQLAEKRKSLELITDVSSKIKTAIGAAPKRRTKQPISDMIVKVLGARKKPIQPKYVLESLTKAGYVGSPAVMYATLGRLVKAKRLSRDNKGGYALVGGGD